MKRMTVMLVVVIAVAAGVVTHFATLDGLDGLFFACLSETEDTVYAPQYSDRGFRRVRLGMSLAEVDGLIGAPLGVWTNQDTTVGMRWSKSPGSHDYRCRVLQFDNGTVVDKHSAFYVD